MQTAFTGVIPMRGDLRITVRRADTGEKTWGYEIRNTITFSALSNLVLVLAQKTFGSPGALNDPTNSSVLYLRVGDNVTAPVRSNTNLLSPLPSSIAPYTITLIDANKTLTTSNPFEMKITATIPATDLNGSTLREAGLFTRGSTSVAPPGEYPVASGRYPELFARQVHPDIVKNAAFVVDYDWRIAFTS